MTRSWLGRRPRREEGHHALADDVLQRSAAYRQLAIHEDNSHYAMAERFELKNKILGIPVVVTAAAVSTAIFATLETKAAIGWKLATGLVSLAAAILAALQTFLNYAEQAQQHKASARDYSRMRRQLELFELRHCLGETDRDQALHELTEFARQLDELEAHEPTISDRVYKKIQRRYSTSEGRDAASRSLSALFAKVGDHTPVSVCPDTLLRLSLIGIMPVIKDQITALRRHNA